MKVNRLLAQMPACTNAAMKAKRAAIYSAAIGTVRPTMDGTHKHQPPRIFKAGAFEQNREPLRSTTLKRKGATHHEADAKRPAAPHKPIATIYDLLRRTTGTIPGEAEARTCPTSADLHLSPDAERREPECLADDVTSIHAPRHLSTHGYHNR